MQDTPMIICPVCGQHYLPAEIFVPKSFFGNPKEIKKDDVGNIEYFLGDDMNLEESYICDGCGSTLNINANISFNVTAEDQTIEEEYISTFEKPKKIKLPEVNLFD